MAAKLLDGLPKLDVTTIPDLVERLSQMHAGSAGEARGREPETPLYGALRAGVEWMEREARRHAEFVDRLIQPAAPARAAAYQETLYLQGRCGERTGGRFRSSTVAPIPSKSASGCGHSRATARLSPPRPL